MTVSIIIPNYNGQELLKKNLPKVIQSLNYFIEKSNKGEIIIIDDASTDGSVECINSIVSQNKKTADIKLLVNSKNLGFSSTINNGVKAAFGEIIILLNTDVEPEKEFLDPLLKHFEEKNVFAVGCMDKSIEGNKEVLRGRGLGQWKRGFLIHSRGEINKKNTLWASGGSAAFRKSIWEKLEGMQEIYNPFYWEDIDLSYRALKSGYTILFEPESVVTHRHVTGAIKRNYSTRQIETIAYRNQFIFVWKNATDLDLQLSCICWLPYHFYKALIRKDTEFFFGFFQAFIRLPQIIQLNFNVATKFTKTDKEVIQALQ